MTAEIHRNLGEFDKCLGILQGIEDKELLQFKDRIIVECGKGNRWVVQLD